MSILWTSAAWSWPLLLVVAAGAIFLTVRFYGQSRPHPSKGLRQTLIIFRGAVFLLLVLAVAGPIFSRIFKHEIPAQLVFLLEDSGSMGIENGEPGVDRWSAALEFATQVDSVFTHRALKIKTRFLRGNGQGELLEFHLDDLVITDPLNHGTDLAGLLEMASVRLSVDPVRALVLLSDGQETVNQVRGASSLSALSKVDILVAGVGDTQGNSDRIIKDVRYPESAFQGDKITVETTVLQRLSDSVTAGPLTVYLKQGDAVLAQKTIENASGATNVELSFVPSDVGLQMLELEVSPLANEGFLANNIMSLGVDVHKARSRLLLLAERPGWNVRFLTQAARMENRLALEVVYASEQGLVFADSLTIFKAPETVQQWLQYDGVILAGWGGAAGRLNHPLLGEAVNAGLGLLVLPDLQENLRGTLRPPASELLNLLPVTFEKLKWSRGPFFARGDSLAYGHSVFNGLESIPGVNMLREAPPLAAVIPSQIKEGSQQIFLALPNELDTSSGLPLLVVSKRQAGRVAFWTGSRLWEMAFWERTRSAPDQLVRHTFRRALRNLLVWLADGNQESGLSFAGRRAFYQEGEVIGLGARWLDMRGQPVAQGRLSLEVGKLSDSGEVSDTRSFPVDGYDVFNGQYGFSLPAMPPGRYSIQLLGHGDTELKGPMEELMVTSHSVEQTQVRQDGRRLRQLADRMGGNYYNIHESVQLQRALAKLETVDWSSSSGKSRRTWDFTADWPFILVIVLLLGCEWFLRRRHGML